MFSVTRYSCATGYFSFGHEIGHNMGLNHDVGTMGRCDSHPNSYNYAYRDPDGSFRTIMAYYCRTTQCDNNKANGCTRIQRFSTPLLTYETTGKKLGTVKADNARVLNENRYEVANFFRRPTSAPTVSSDLPSSAPIISSDPPTSSPNSSCTNNDAFSFTKNNKTKKCNWISKNSRRMANRRNAVCNQDDVSQNCKLACGLCANSPTLSPNSSCTNNDAFSFTKNNKTKKCNWISKNSRRMANRRNSVCNQDDVSQNCKLACGLCGNSNSDDTPAASPGQGYSCEDSSTFEFELDNAKIQGCYWLTKNSSKAQQRRNGYCDRDYSGTLVKEACINSCGNC